MSVETMRGEISWQAMTSCLPCSTYFDTIDVEKSCGIKRLSQFGDLADIILTQMEMILGTIYTHFAATQFVEG